MSWVLEMLNFLFAYDSSSQNSVHGVLSGSAIFYDALSGSAIFTTPLVAQQFFTALLVEQQFFMAPLGQNKHLTLSFIK
jgi:hypothetical protein